jgi:Uma2 family endonuclease
MVVKAIRRTAEDGRLLFSVDDYYRMSEIGILDEDSRVELLGGDVFVMAPIGSRHAAAVNRLAALLIRQLGDRAVIGPQNPVHLSDDSEPQPDLSVLKPRPDYYASGHPGPSDVLLLIEVAETSLAHDRDLKLDLYARSGIVEVWIVDLTGEAVTAYRDPDGEKYAWVREHRRGEALSPSSFPDVTLAVDVILG